jgi:hypothetical protein
MVAIEMAESHDVRPNLSFERRRSAVVAHFAARRLWRVAQLMIR